MDTNPSRRAFLKTAGIVFGWIPLIGYSGHAVANTNTVLREQYKYQNTPSGSNSCTSCLEFIPGKSENESGACKIIPGDDEISSHGYCIRWNTL
jgi:hypothetical protein